MASGSRPGDRLGSDRTTTDTRELTAHLAEVRKHGYAVDRQERARLGALRSKPEWRSPPTGELAGSQV